MELRDDGGDMLSIDAADVPALFCSVDNQSCFYLHGLSIVQEKGFRSNACADYHFFCFDHHLYFLPSIKLRT